MPPCSSILLFTFFAFFAVLIGGCINALIGPNSTPACWMLLPNIVEGSPEAVEFWNFSIWANGANNVPGWQPFNGGWGPNGPVCAPLLPGGAGTADIPHRYRTGAHLPDTGRPCRAVQRYLRFHRQRTVYARPTCAWARKASAAGSVVVEGAEEAEEVVVGFLTDSLEAVVLAAAEVVRAVEAVPVVPEVVHRPMPEIGAGRGLVGGRPNPNA